MKWIEEASGKKCTTVGVMSQLAKHLAAKGVVPPSEMYWIFSDAIAERTEVNRMYAALRHRGNIEVSKEECDSHVHFIEA